MKLEATKEGSGLVLACVCVFALTYDPCALHFTLQVTELETVLEAKEAALVATQEQSAQQVEQALQKQREAAAEVR